MLHFVHLYTNVHIITTLTEYCYVHQSSTMCFYDVLLVFFGDRDIV